MDGGEGLTHVFPSAETLATADLSGIGLPAARAEAIRQLSIAVAGGELSFSGVVDPARFIERFKKLPGIGEWTAQYVAMRALGEPDAFPAADLHLLRAAGVAKSKQLEERAECWRPWRAYAAMHLWQENAHDQLHVHGKPRRAVAAGGDDDGLRLVGFAEGKGAREPESDWRYHTEPLQKAVGQLEAYFAGNLRSFDLPLNLQGTPFQLVVWRALQDIPYGQTISYGELAGRIGNPKASRAVGLANGSNPIPIIVPCHRVIGSNGKLTGYGGGLCHKETLLALERKVSALALSAVGNR